MALFHCSNVQTLFTLTHWNLFSVLFPQQRFLNSKSAELASSVFFSQRLLTRFFLFCFVFVFLRYCFSCALIFCVISLFSRNLLTPIRFSSTQVATFGVALFRFLMSPTSQQSPGQIFFFNCLNIFFLFIYLIIFLFKSLVRASQCYSDRIVSSVINKNIVLLNLF